MNVFGKGGLLTLTASKFLSKHKSRKQKMAASSALLTQSSEEMLKQSSMQLLPAASTMGLTSSDNSTSDIQLSKSAEKKVSPRASAHATPRQSISGKSGRRNSVSNTRITERQRSNSQQDKSINNVKRGLNRDESIKE